MSQWTDPALLEVLGLPGPASCDTCPGACALLSEELFAQLLATASGKSGGPALRKELIRVAQAGRAAASHAPPPACVMRVITQLLARAPPPAAAAADPPPPKPSAAAAAAAWSPICLPSTPLIDIGVNLGHPHFAKDLPAVVARAHAAGVTQMLITGTSLASSRDAIALARQHPGSMFATVGVHPHDAQADLSAAGQSDEELYAQLEALIVTHRAPAGPVVAVGECGLDYNRDLSPRDIQRRVFRLHVRLACQLQLPMFVHEREAHADLLAILSEFSNHPPVVVHCFTGTSAELSATVAAGHHVGITGFVGMKNRGADLRTFVQTIPLDRLMIESDAPYVHVRKLVLRSSFSGCVHRRHYLRLLAPFHFLLFFFSSAGSSLLHLSLCFLIVAFVVAGSGTWHLTGCPPPAPTWPPHRRLLPG